MMTKFREFSKLFIIIVAVAFVLMMVVQWGANYYGKKGQTDAVGEVNGHKLTFKQFSKMYQQMYEEEKARTGKTTFTEEELQQLRDAVWERFIQQTLLQEEIKRLGITVTDSEVVYQIYNYPLEDFKRHPSFQTNGVFDINKYRASFTNPNIPWLQVEQIYREQLPYVKLQTLITSTVRVSEQELKDEFIKRNLKAKVEYLGVLAPSFNNSALKVSDQEIEAYYQEHKEEFKQPERRALSYVFFPIYTTREDTERVFKEFETIKERLAKGEDFNALALEYSEDPKVQQNKGNLGYFDRNSMPFSKEAFDARVGEVIGPVKTSLGYHLIKIEDRKKENGRLQVKASHILLKVTPAPSRVEDIETRARFFSEDAKDKGFEKQAQKDSLTVKHTGLFTEGGSFIPGIGQNWAIKHWAFSANLHDVSGVYRLDDKGFVVVSVEDIQEAGYKALDKVKRLIASRIRLQKAKEKAREFALTLQPKVKSNIAFKEIANQDTSGKVRYDVTPLFSLDQSIPGVGKEIAFNATAFALQVGERSDLVETSRGYYYLNLLEKTAFDSTAYAKQKDVLRRQILMEKRNKAFVDWYNDLKAKADIVDNRKLFNL